MSSAVDRRIGVFYPYHRGGISERTTWSIFLVGCGGTGSFIAHALAQAKASKMGFSEKIDRIVFIDPDDVEERNIGRQNFAPADICYNKAQTLAFRYNLAFGLNIEWIGDFFKKDMLPKRETSQSRTMVIGGVDTGKARRDIKHIIKEREENIVWMDCGNGYDRGQITIGNTFSKKELKKSVDPDVNIAHYLPYPSLALPELLGDEEVEMLSCSEALEREAQGLYVNRFMACMAGEYLRNFLESNLKHFLTWMNLQSMEMVTLPICQYHIDRYSGLCRFSLISGPMS